MLYSLHIQNIALIKDLTVEFSAGLNVLSGETGAGKSILIDSIAFILGGRSDKTLIRYGETQASVEAAFGIEGNEGVRTFFEEYGIEGDESEILLRRVMTADNRNECRINGRLVTLAALKNLASLLADIYGQNEHQSILKPSRHIVVTDGLNADILTLKNGVKALYEAYKGVTERLDAFGDAQYREQRLDILEFQIDEINRAAIKDGEEERLREERARIHNVGKLTSALSEAYDALDGDEIGASSLVASALASVLSIAEYDKDVSELSERLSDVKSVLKDIVCDTKACLEGLNYDERYADGVESRLDEIKLVKKKYGQTLEAVRAYFEKINAEYDGLKDSENILSKLRKEKEELFLKYAEAANRLSAFRKKTAEKFEKDIRRELNDLSMAGTSFRVEFFEVDIEKNMRQDGYDRIEFLISPNEGEPLRPLAKIISGGEMSRFMLALKSIISDADNIDTMIFDEIDTGISGKVAEVVAQKLSLIAQKRQVLAVTHLPQLASYADRHFLISKRSAEGKTLTSIALLDENDTVAELARLSGGSDTALAIPHAKNIKEKAELFKKNRK
ncbi:MAG: DNA repair protein RecN [Clostridiales bacterium]|jgi:DNA repair protein RecN (Recombination protein N)|nr:DNA repair protein RecN [Clostridiales bacterium]